MKFGRKLRRLREQKEWTQSELARQAGVTKSGLANWEHGHRIPTIEVAQKLCKALGVPVAVFDGCEYAPVTPRGKGRPSRY